MTYLTVVGGSDLTAFGSDPSRGAGFASSCRGGSNAHPHRRRINGRMACLSFLSRNAPPGTIRLNTKSTIPWLGRLARARSYTLESSAKNAKCAKHAKVFSSSVSSLAALAFLASLALVVGGG